ncbi:MAG: 3TM-type holin [Bdellovibrio sp.]
MAIDPLTAALDVGGKLIDRLWPDPQEAAEAKRRLVELQQTGELQVLLGQMKVNEVEAANQSIWVSGWRPAVGWVCALAFFYKFVFAPLFVLLLTTFGLNIVLPVLDFTEMSTILLGMLGIGGLRTVEKLKGVPNPQ